MVFVVGFCIVRVYGREKEVVGVLGRGVGLFRGGERGVEI